MVRSLSRWVSLAVSTAAILTLMLPILPSGAWASTTDAAQTPPAEAEGWWAMTHRPSASWLTAEAEASDGPEIPMWRYLLVVQSAGNRLLTVDPRTNARLWLNADNVGPVGPPPDDYFAAPPADTTSLGIPARIVGAPDTYDHPEDKHYYSLRRLQHNQSVTVHGLVEADEAGRWARIGDSEYVPMRGVRTPPAPPRTFPGRWIDANLNEPVMVTAYEGETPVYAALAVKGAAAFQTPVGQHRIQRRVANEIMDSATIGIPRDSPNGYYLRDVLYTQYFNSSGAALHYNYWRSDFGYSGSKGCLGFNLEDATFFWQFAGVGTVVNIHY